MLEITHWILVQVQVNYTMYLKIGNFICILTVLMILMLVVKKVWKQKDYQIKRIKKKFLEQPHGILYFLTEYMITFIIYMVIIG